MLSDEDIQKLPEWIDTETAAQILRVSRQQAQKWAREGYFKRYHKGGRRYEVFKQHVIDFPFAGGEGRAPKHDDPINYDS